MSNKYMQIRVLLNYYLSKINEYYVSYFFIYITKYETMKFC